MKLSLSFQRKNKNILNSIESLDVNSKVTLEKTLKSYSENFLLIKLLTDVEG